MQRVVSGAQRSVKEQLGGIEAACGEAIQGVKKLDGVIDALWWRGGVAATVIMAIIVIGAYMATSSLRKEYAYLSIEIGGMNKVYELLKDSTWNMTLHTAEDGKKWILLPKDKSFGGTGGWTQGGVNVQGIRVLSKGEE
jgi:hypothetical protein